MLLIAQASTAPAMLPATVDLHAAITKPCAAAPDEITVCAKPEDETYRLRPLDVQRFEPKPLTATTNFLGGTAGIDAEQKSFSNGSVSKQLKVALKFKF
jgi:hypothetical protein